MKTSLILLSFLFSFSTVSPAQSVQRLRPDSLLTEIILIGTMHDRHDSNPYYDTQELKRIMLELRPAVLLIEVPEKQMGADGRVHEEDRIGPELTTTDQVANELHIPQIPFDHPNRNERNTELLKRWNDIQPRIDQLSKEIKSRGSLDPQFVSLYDLAHAALENEQIRATPAIVNSDASDALTSIYYSISQDILIAIAGHYPGYDDLVEGLKYTRDWWLERNNVMAANILKTARSYRGKRMVIQTGSDHRYILRDLLKNKPGIALKEFWEILPK